MSVVAVEHDHGALASGPLRDVVGNGGIDGGPLDHIDARGHWVRLDRFAVVRTDVDVDAEHAAATAHQFEHGGEEHQGTSVRDSGFDNELRPRTPDDLLERKD